MANTYPIWIEINSCAYQSKNKSYGIKEHGTQTIYVGSPKANNERFGEVNITKSIKQNFKGFINVVVYRYSFEGVILKEMIFSNNKGRAGELLKTISKMNRIKSL